MRPAGRFGSAHSPLTLTKMLKADACRAIIEQKIGRRHLTAASQSQREVEIRCEKSVLAGWRSVS